MTGAAAAVGVVAAADVGGTIAQGALWVAIPLAVLAGLVSFVSPCVLPLVPGYLGFIGGAVQPRAAAHGVGGAEASVRHDSTPPEAAAQTVQPATAPSPAEPGRARLLLGVALFIAGFTIVFMALNILSGVFGQFLIQYADLLMRIAGVIVIVLGLIFVGLFGRAQRTLRLPVRSNLGLVGAPLLGIALGIGWAPCIGPTLGTIIAISYGSADPSRGALLGLAYSLGLGIPFLLLAWGFSWATRASAFLRRHIRVINLIGGGLLILLGLLMVTGVWGMLMSALQGVFPYVDLPL